MAVWRRLDVLILQDPPHRRSTNSVPQVLENSLDAGITPCRVLLRESDDEFADLLHDSSLAGRVRFGGPLRGNQPAVPTHDRVGRHDAGNPVQEASSELLALRREAYALVIVEAQPAALELLLQDAVLLDEVLDRSLLLAVHPA